MGKANCNDEIEKRDDMSEEARSYRGYDRDWLRLAVLKAKPTTVPAPALEPEPVTMAQGDWFARMHLAADGRAVGGSMERVNSYPECWGEPGCLCNKSGRVAVTCCAAMKARKM